MGAGQVTPCTRHYRYFRYSSLPFPCVPERASFFLDGDDDIPPPPLRALRAKPRSWLEWVSLHDKYLSHAVTNSGRKYPRTVLPSNFIGRALTPSFASVRDRRSGV
jgi:hypothetical protein